MDKLNFRITRTVWADIEIDVEAFIEYYATEWDEWVDNSDDNVEIELIRKEFVRDSLYAIGLAEYFNVSDVGDGVTILETDEEYELE